MATQIKCPNCGHQFALGEAEAEEYKKELKQQMTQFIRQKEEEYKKRTDEFEQQKIQLEQLAIRKAGEQFTAKIKSLEEERNQKAQQLIVLEKKELDLLRQKSELEHQQKNFELELEKRLLESRKEIEAQASKKEQEMFDLKMKEKDLQLEGLKNTIEELKRKSEQGSMQIQGESQELLLEEILHEAFPFDLIEEIKKGTEGADCLQLVRNPLARECGRIIYESKRTKTWSSQWISKLKSDMQLKQADVALLVTQTFPKDMDRFGEKDGIWICSFSEVIPLATILRDSLIRISEARKQEENKETKAQLLYNFLTSNEFRLQWDGILEAYMSMKQSIEKERVQAEKNWKEREKQLFKIMKGATGFIGSVKGLGGMDIPELPSLENGPEDN